MFSPRILLFPLYSLQLIITRRLLQRPNISPEGSTEDCHIFCRKQPDTPPSPPFTPSMSFVLLHVMARGSLGHPGHRVRFCFRLVSCLFVYLFMFKKINSKILDLIVFRYTGNQDLKSTHRAICSVINNLSSRCGMSY